jgi:hypothetical protein
MAAQAAAEGVTENIRAATEESTPAAAHRVAHAMPTMGASFMEEMHIQNTY